MVYRHCCEYSLIIIIIIIIIIIMIIMIIVSAGWPHRSYSLILVFTSIASSPLPLQAG